jgi:hypothetical protein
MVKKTLAWITLPSFLIFSWSCVIHSWQKEPLLSISPEKREGTEVSAVQTKSGEKIDFNKNPAARIQTDSVIGEKLVQNIEIEKSRIEKPKNLPVQTVFNLTTTSGDAYKVTFWIDREDKIILFGYLSCSIPISDVNLVWIRKVDVAATILLTGLGCLAFIGGLYKLLFPHGLYMGI